MAEKNKPTNDMHLSIVIPFFNEEDNIEMLFTKLQETLDSFPHKTEVVLVDDGSVDQSVTNIRKFSYKLKHLKVVQLSRNFGAIAAFMARGARCL